MVAAKSGERIDEGSNLFGCSQRPMTFRRRLAIYLAVALLLPTFSRAQNTRNVLVLHVGSANQPGHLRISKVFRDIFGSDARNQLFEEYFDQERLSLDDATLVETLGKKYQGKKIDLVVSDSGPALKFLLRHGEQLWPGTPEIFTFVDRREVPPTLPANMTGIASALNFGPTVDLALQLMPNIHRVFFVSGASPREEAYRRLSEQEFRRFAGKIDITYLHDLPLSELLIQVSQLPADSALVFFTMLRDATGHPYTSAQVLPMVTATANVPVYVLFDSDIGTGAVGGVVLDLEHDAEQAAGLGLRVLERGTASGLPVEQTSPNQTVVDWRQLQRWGISENKLPRGTVRFRPPSLWQQYKWYVLGGGAAIVAQLVLIIILLTEIRRRKSSDLVVNNLSGRIINATEEERKRIARELHDDIAQRLSLVSVELDMMEKDFPKDKLTGRESLHEPLQQVRDIITDVHNLSHQLHSQKLQMLGLAVALREICQQLSKQYGLDIQLTAEEIKVPLPEDLALCFYRVAQEALSNSVKHSRSSHIEVRLAATDGTLIMTIKDYGEGFDSSTAANGLGLATMRERLRLIGGKLLITSLPGTGTELTAQVRLESPLRQGLAHDTAMGLVAAAANPAKDDENHAA